jgi:hypothetical protein
MADKRAGRLRPEYQINRGHPGNEGAQGWEAGPRHMRSDNYLRGVAPGTIPIRQRVTDGEIAQMVVTALSFRGSCVQCNGYSSGMTGHIIRPPPAGCQVVERMLLIR